MLLGNIFLFVSAATALTTQTARKRDATELATATLIQDVDNINNGVLGLTAAVNAFPGTNLVTLLVSGVSVLGGVADIHVVNRKGYVDANLAPTLNATESKEIVDFTVATVGNTIPASIDALKAKKQQFTDAGLVPVVLASLSLLENDHDTFSAALIAKTTGGADVEAEGNAVVAKIHDAIQSGIDYFSS